MQEVIYAKDGGKDVQVNSGRSKELNKVTTKCLGGGSGGERDEAVARNCYKGPSTVGQRLRLCPGADEELGKDCNVSQSGINNKSVEKRLGGLQPENDGV